MEGKITKLTQGPFRYEFMNGQRFISFRKIFQEKKFGHLVIDFGTRSLPVHSSPDFLTPAEINDVETSLNEIREGQVKKFRNVDEFLKELKK